MITVPSVKSTETSMCIACESFAFVECATTEGVWKRGDRSFTVRLPYCWKHYRELAKSLTSVNAYTEAVTREIERQERGHNLPAGRLSNEEFARSFAEDLVRACGADRYPAQKLALIKLVRDRTRVGVIQAKRAVEVAYEELSDAAPDRNGQAAGVP